MLKSTKIAGTYNGIALERSVLNDDFRGYNNYKHYSEKIKGLRAKAKKLAGLGIEFTLTKLNIRNKELDELMRPSRSEQDLRLIDRDLNFFKCHLLDDFNVLGGIDTTNPFLGHAYK